MGYNRPKKKMKKYLYLLIACTMMCFAGCEEKGDEIDNTTDNTGESVEINEANLVGTWKIVSKVAKDGEFDSIYYYDDHYEEYQNDEYEGEQTFSYETPLWTYAFTIKADKTYEFEEEKVTKTRLVVYGDGGSILGYNKEYYQEHGTWSLKGKNFVIQWIEGCNKWVYGINENEDYRTKPYTDEHCNTFEEFHLAYQADKDPDLSDYYYGYFDYFYESERLEAVEEGGEMTCSIIKLTSTELVIQTKYKEFDEDHNEWGEGEITEYYKKVK